jgi:hypothetical protein
MIQNSFKIAFSVQVFHSYFDQDICSCLQFNPGAVTRQLIKRFNFKLKSKINGFDFYTSCNSAIPAFLQYISSATQQSFFDFDITTNNANFYHFTNLPVSWLGQLIYDSQAKLSTCADGSVQLAETLSANTSNTSIGSLTVRFDDIINNVPALFTINYQARATQWQYYIINKSALALENPAISGKTDIKFDGPQNVTIESGDQAILFSSGSNLLPLSQIPAYRFDLVNNQLSNSNELSKKTSAAKTIFKGLPNPDPGWIGMVNINTEIQVSSPMYIYV